MPIEFATLSKIKQVEGPFRGDCNKILRQAWVESLVQISFGVLLNHLSVHICAAKMHYEFISLCESHAAKAIIVFPLQIRRKKTPKMQTNEGVLHSQKKRKKEKKRSVRWSEPCFLNWQERVCMHGVLTLPITRFLRSPGTKAVPAAGRQAGQTNVTAASQIGSRICNRVSPLSF